MSEALSDISAPVYAALMEPRTVLRVERRMFYFNAAMAVIFIIALKFWKLASVNVLLYFAAMWTTAKHPDLIAIYLRYRLQADLYRPWVSAVGWIRNRRPEGFGRL
jgi:type IV secretory pathway TrbD component